LNIGLRLFWYSAPFTETLLVGVLPIRSIERIEWDATAMKASNTPEADTLIRKPYRSGLELPSYSSIALTRSLFVVVRWQRLALRFRCPGQNDQP